MKIKLLLVLLAASQFALAQQSVHDIAEAVDRRYNNLRSLETHFTETYQGAGLSRSESGTLWLKKPGKMRWEYQQPREKLFISDGKTAWFYVPGEPQARRAPVKKLDDLRSPLRYLLGKTKLEKEFEGLSLAPDANRLNPADVVLRGIPKGLADRFSQVLLEITPDRQINRLVLEEVDGSITDFRFSGQKEDVAVPDERFIFRAPPGVEIVEARELTPGS